MKHREWIFILLAVCSSAAGQLALLRYSTSTYCVDSGDSRSSALALFVPPSSVTQNNAVSSWKSPSPPPPQGLVEALSCDLTAPGKCGGWERQGLTRESNFEGDELPPVFDTRWEKFPFIQHLRRYNFDNMMPVMDPRPGGKPLSLHFSILAPSDANLLLHTHKDHYNSPWYLVAIDGWENSHMTAFRKCQQGWPSENYLGETDPCHPLKASKENMPLLTLDKWVHFTLRIIRSSSNQAHISLSQGEKLLLEWIDEKDPIDVNFVSVRFYNKPGYIRFNKYDVLRLNSEKVHVALPSSAFLCVSVTFLNSGGPARLQVVTREGAPLAEVELTESEGWQVARLETTLHENVELHENVDHSLVLEKTSGGRFLLGDVRVCNQNEVHVSSLVQILTNKATCMNLMTEEIIQARKPTDGVSAFPSCSGEYFGAHCNLTCSFLNGLSSCYGGSFCDVSTCSCAQLGYTGEACTYVCPNGRYGRACSSFCGKCASTVTCNFQTGACNNRGCLTGWKAARCHIPMYVALSLHDAVEDSIELTIKVIEHQDLDTSNISSFQLQYKRRDDRDWTHHAVLSWPPSSQVTISELRRNKVYLVRGVVLDQDRMPIRLQVPEEVTVTTKCRPVDFTEFEVAPHQTYFTVALNVKDPDEICPTDQYLVGVNEKNYYPYPLKNLPINITKLNIYKALEANTEYKLIFSIKGQEKQYDKIYKTTPGPPGPVESLTVDTSDSVSARVTWAAPLHTGGDIKNYFVTNQKCHYVNNENNDYNNEHNNNEDKCDNQNREDTAAPLTISADVTLAIIPLASLAPNSRYQVAVWAVTEEEGPREFFEFTTPPAPGSVHDLVIDPTTGKVTWTSVHDVITYNVSYMLVCSHEESEECLERTKDVDKSSGSFAVEGAEFKLPFDKMHPSSSYNVSVSALRVYLGEPAFYSIRTPEVKMGSSHVLAITLSLLFLLVLALVLFFLWRRHNKRRGLVQSDQQRLQSNANLGGEVAPSGLDVVPAGDKVAWRRSPVTPDLNSQVAPDATAGAGKILSRPVRLAELEHYVESGLASGEIRKQHAMFPRGQTQPWKVGRQPENKRKNRYGNLVAYDATRVKLGADSSCDYINANYIDGYNNPRAYIATQGPKENTVDDFWHMIWQENVHLILALANCVEGGKAKVEQYWPEAGRQDTYDDVIVTTTSQEVYADFTFRHFEVHYQATTRKVLQLHFTSWPDHGVPMYPQSVASYLKKILITDIKGPVLVHCSAGVGRTGTVILAVACLRMAAVEGQVDPLGLLQIMRAQRPNMVDNAEQYELVHVVLLECLVADSFNIECNQFPAQLRQMLGENRSILGRQFSRLNKLCLRDAALKKVRTDYSWPHEKSRFPDIVPGSIGRVILSRSTGGSDFINAVYVDGFRVKHQFIVTQNPLPSTLDDFWHMLVQTRAGLVLVLNQPDPSTDPSSCTFWPEADSELVLSDTSSLVLKHHSESKLFEYRNLQLRTERMVQGCSECTQHRVNVVTLKGWSAGQQLPPSTDLLLELWEEAERMFAGVGPIVVTCHDGATACGLFLAVSFVVEKMKLEQEVDVGLAVRIMRLARPQFLASLDQFEFVHQVALNYLDTFETYANFT